MAPEGDGAIAYLLKGFPRLSELFIASELERMEQAGLALRLFVLKPRDEEVTHPVVARLRARPHYLPDAGSISTLSTWGWLRVHGARFWPALCRVIRRRPLGLARAAASALAQAWRARRGFWASPRRVYLKEWFQAVGLADALLADPAIRHLHAHFCHGATTVAWLASRITGLGFSFTAHAKDLYRREANPAGLLERKLRAARFAVTCTEAGRKHLLALAPDARVHRIYHGLNSDLEGMLRELPPRELPASRELRVLAVARRVHKKGLDVLVEACARLQAAGVPVRLRLVGPPGDADETLRRLAARLGAEPWLALEGALTQRALLGEYQRADLSALPCRVLADGDRDGIPNVLVEAMACGLPVVTTDVSGIGELVTDGWNGLVVHPDDVSGLAAALARLHEEPGLRRRLGEAARATVRESFDGTALAAELAARFREVLA
jgi:glycosyltransferase involved in cell wall biosynthesis